MAILWCGGEPIDFPNATAPSVEAGKYNANYARCSLKPDVAIAKGSIFPGGAVTSCWLSAYVALTNIAYTGENYIGLGKSGTNYSIGVGNNAAAAGKVDIFKWDGSTKSVLATSAAAAWIGIYYMNRVDIQVVDYGGAATINVYINGASSADVTYTGDVTVGGNTNLDEVFLFSNPGHDFISEVIVATTDTRTMRLVTIYPNAAGDVNDFTGAYTDIDEIATSDADLITDNTVGHQFTTNLSALPAGSFAVLAVKEAIRASRTADSTPTSINMGVKSNGSVSATENKALTTSYATYERLMATNPVTSVQFSIGEIGSLQMVLESAA